MESSSLMTNAPRLFTRRLLIWLCGLMVLLVALVFIFSFQKVREFVAPTASNGKPLDKVPRSSELSLPINKSAELPYSRNSTSAAPTNITYRPGQPRAVAQFLGVLNADDRKSNWYLYARSDQEAKWLDFYGFPTPAEDERLKQSTDAELKLLVDAGDLNAKAHQAIRLAKAIFARKDINNAPIAQGTMGYLMMEGGPYQAITVLRAYGDMLTDFAYLPQEQRTEQQRKILEIYGISADHAYANGKIYGDYSIGVTHNTISPMGMRGELGLSSNSISAVSFANGVATASKERIERGLPPITIMPRPEPPGGNILNFLANGTIVLERR
jgi:hypothetical protein